MKMRLSKVLLGLLILIVLPLSLYAKADKVKALLFYGPHCGSCIKLKNEFLPGVLNKYKDTLELKMLDTSDPKNLSVLISVCKQYNEEKYLIPAMLVGNDFIVGRKEIESKLEISIQRYSKTKFFLPFLISPKSLLEEFKSISFFTIISAGLIDGINPCAFAVIVFFVSFLGVYGYDKREFIYIGGCYVLSVFITYILIGLGLFKFLYSMSDFYFLMKLFYYVVAGLCFALAAFALYDYSKFKKSKDTSGLILQLPKFLKKRINLAIGSKFRQKKYTRIAELCFISLSAGHAVSILEAACTGQVYVPTIAFILRVPHLRVRAFAYLVLYNAMFVLPLIVIFILSLIGFTSTQFNRFLRRNLGRVKIIMFLLFLCLGVFMLLLN